jgi:hypothetical protein
MIEMKKKKVMKDFFNVLIDLPGRNIPIVSFDVNTLSWIFQASVITVDVDKCICSGDIVKIDFRKFEGNKGDGVEIKSWWNERCCCSDDGMRNVN